MNHKIRVFSALCIAFPSLTLVMPGRLHAAIPTGVKLATFYDVATIKFKHLVWFGEIPGRPGNFLTVEQDGIVSLLESAGAGKKTVLFSIPAQRSGSIQNGAYSIAFHPDFKTNRKYYYLYRPLTTTVKESVIEERRMDATFKKDEGSVRKILGIPQRTIHSSGSLVFGPDGFLYISQSDTDLDALNMEHFGGKFLRIDVNRSEDGKNYAVPPDNPWAKSTDVKIKKEIWAYGLRVPWRFSFDALTGEIYMGDVGDSKAEEINIVKKGGNYGAGKNGGVEGFCKCSGSIDPVTVLTRTEGKSVTGGYVYRANSTSAFYGVYLFGDFETKKIFGLRQKDGKLQEMAVIGAAPGRITSFAQDAQSNVYVVTYEGIVYKMEHPELKSQATSIQVARRSIPMLHPGRSIPGQLRLIRADGKLIRIKGP